MLKSQVSALLTTLMLFSHLSLPVLANVAITPVHWVSSAGKMEVKIGDGTEWQGEGSEMIDYNLEIPIDKNADEKDLRRSFRVWTKWDAALCETRGRGSGKPTQEFRFGIKHEEGPEYGRIELLNPGCHGNHAVVCTGRDGGPVLTPAGTKGEEGCSLD